jgi:hypothetical protein
MQSEASLMWNQDCGKLASITQSQTSTPINVDSTTNTAGKALSPAALFEEFMIASDKNGNVA